jgi:ferredoxin
MISRARDHRLRQEDGGGVMKVILDELKCDAVGVCVDACPEVFALDDDEDVARVLEAGPAESLRESVLRAAGLCPKAAIEIED